MEKSIIIKIFLIISALLLSGCSQGSLSNLNPFASDTTPTINPSPATAQASLWQNNTQQIWAQLQSLPVSRLQTLRNDNTNKIQAGWIELALISKHHQLDTKNLINELSNWRANYPNHPANSLLPNDQTLNQLSTAPIPQHIVVFLPGDGKFGSAGQKIRQGLLNAYYANSATRGKQTIQFYDTQNKNIVALYQQALSQGADFIIGPLLKPQVMQLSHSSQINKPTLALNYIPDSYFLPSQFYQFGLLPEDEAGQMAQRAREAGYAEAIIIAPANAWGKRLSAAFAKKWATLGGNIQEAWYFSKPSLFNEQIARLLKVDPSADKKLMQDKNNHSILEQQRRHDFDVIFLFAQPSEARLIVPLLKYYYANNVPIYATSAVYSGNPNPTKDVDLNGVTVCDIPWKVQAANKQADRLYAVGQDAYLLSQTLPRLLSLPAFPIYGATGALTLSGHQIHRRLPCITVRNGTI